jgi:DNA-binding XRE family transcriptional regulator
MITAEQLRAARAMLQMDQAELAKISSVSVETIKRLERQTGQLHAKIETITAIQKAFEAQHLEFLDDTSRGAGVRLAPPDKRQLLRKTLVGEWAYLMDQSLEAECATDPRLFEHGEKRLIEVLQNLSTRILPSIVRSALSDPPKGWQGNFTVATRSGVDVELTPPRQRVSNLTPEEHPAFIESRDGTSTRTMSAPERALADAKMITPQMLDLVRDSDIGSLENRQFIRAFVGALPASERGNLTSASGGLSAEGLARVRNAVLAKAYGDADVLARITESTDDDVKSISNALVGAAPTWAKMRVEIDDGRVPEELDITTDLMEAVKRTADIRSKGMKIGDYLAQEDAFDKYKNDVDLLIANFYDQHTGRALGAPKIRDFLEFYAREAAKVSTEEGLALGIPKVTAYELKTTAAAKTQGVGARPTRPRRGWDSAFRR